ncbi:MAG: putative phosphoenolpyruvate synthase [Candidatus Woesearchaeota archaeon]|nr:putative phosphoenolpyruvate synthase [Candidatus Woesearchaeota archaeon]
MDKANAMILWFDQVGIEDTPFVGGKNASLGEMYQNLTKKGVSIPNGFCITAHAYRYLLEHNKIVDKIQEILSDLDVHDIRNLQERGEKVRQTIRETKIPDELKKQILSAYKDLCNHYNKDSDVAVRSSATAEDLPDASFAGQQETYLNIRGEHALFDAVKKCFASLFTNRAISYREDKGFDHFSIALSVTVQKMIRSDLACSGVMFSIDTESGFRNAAFITGAWGLGENVVQGKVNPDEFYVFKPALKKGFKPILKKKLGDKRIKMIYDMQGNKPVKDVPVSVCEQHKFTLSDKEVLKLAKWACIIEDHYSNKAGHEKPMDMEWAKDGISEELFIVQARPETVHANKDKNKLKKWVMKQQGPVIIEGKSVGEKIGQGKARVIKDVHGIHDFKKGEVLITEMTDPDWEPIMKIASAIVTNRGGRTCHAAIISRELGIPCVVGTDDGTTKVKPGQDVTVDCSQGEKGYVYKGILKFDINEFDLKDFPETKTKVMMNLGMPSKAFELSFIPNSGVGLVREEFIINSSIGIHPMALIEYNKLQDENVKRQIDEKTFGYKNKVDYYVDKLSQGISMIAAAFWPKDVIVRLSDFKSNEYANLIGGKLYEPTEDNPMIGWRGASRYYSDFAPAFALECQALHKVRSEMGLKNVKVMVPFCRTVEEGKKVINEMNKNGLKQGEEGLEVYVMCEIPANVILADQFADIFDGFSIGSNDLTQLTLGLDRDSELVSDIYDERNLAVKRLIKKVITVAKKKKRKIGICGQAPSDFPDFAQFLVECGIDSISLNPDSVIKTTLSIANKEKEMWM